MNVIDFREKACGRIRQYLDSYLDNELLVETNHEVLKHLSTCPECAQLLENRARLKRRLKEAVAAEQAPAVLLDSIQSRIRQEPRPRLFGSNFGRWGIAVAAALILAVASISVVRNTADLTQTVSNGRSIFQLVSAQAKELLRVGLVDHVHCAIQMGQWKKFLSFEKMQTAPPQEALGKEFIGLVPMVKERLGSKFDLIQGHRCMYKGREYIHLILTGEQGSILSLIITEKQGESFTRAEVAATIVAAGVPVYADRLDELEIAGFESERFLAYVVSNLPREGNLNVASALAPMVYHFLLRTEA